MHGVDMVVATLTALDQSHLRRLQIVTTQVPPAAVTAVVIKSRAPHRQVTTPSEDLRLIAGERELSSSAQAEGEPLPRNTDTDQRSMMTWTSPIVMLVESWTSRLIVPDWPNPDHSMTQYDVAVTVYCPSSV